MDLQSHNLLDEHFDFVDCYKLEQQFEMLMVAADNLATDNVESQDILELDMQNSVAIVFD